MDFFYSRFPPRQPLSRCWLRLQQLNGAVTMVTTLRRSGKRNDISLGVFPFFPYALSARVRLNPVSPKYIRRPKDLFHLLLSTPALSQIEIFPVEISTDDVRLTFPTNTSSKEVFPEPLEPMMARICPDSTAPLTSRRICFTPACPPMISARAAETSMLKRMLRKRKFTCARRHRVRQSVRAPKSRGASAFRCVFTRERKNRPKFDAVVRRIGETSGRRNRERCFPTFCLTVFSHVFRALHDLLPVSLDDVPNTEDDFSSLPVLARSTSSILRPFRCRKERADTRTFIVDELQGIAPQAAVLPQVRSREQQLTALASRR